MATNITFTNIVGAKLRADNSYDENRAYGIEADVHYKGDTVEAVQSGMVTLLEPQVQVATFGEDKYGSLFLSFTGREEERASVLAAVSSFCKAARERSGNLSPLSL